MSIFFRRKISKNVKKWERDAPSEGGRASGAQGCPASQKAFPSGEGGIYAAKDG